MQHGGVESLYGPALHDAADHARHNTSALRIVLCIYLVVFNLMEVKVFMENDEVLLPIDKMVETFRLSGYEHMKVIVNGSSLHWYSKLASHVSIIDQKHHFRLTVVISRYSVVEVLVPIVFLPL